MSNVRHKLEYSAAGIPLQQTIEALQAHQRLLPKALTALTLLALGAEINVVEISVEEIRAGSLLIDLLLELYGIYQKDIDRPVIEGVEALIGVDVPKQYEALITLALFGVVYYISRWAYEAVQKKKHRTSESPHIVGDYNQVITIIANKLSLSSDAVDAAIGAAVQPSRAGQLLHAVAAFIRPARSKPGTTIEGGGFKMSPDAISDFPSDADL